MDSYLNIRTSDIVYYDLNSGVYDDYFESEPTDYRDLKELHKHYQPLCPKPHLVDYGCGTGRALFFIHHFYQVPVTGIEAHEETFKLCQMNLKSYARLHPTCPPIRLEHRPAEVYVPTKDENIFYFFNPFSIDILRKVMKGIETSYKQEPRLMELILYYPLQEYRDYLAYKTPFRPVQTIDLPWHQSKTDRFEIYQLQY